MKMRAADTKKLVETFGPNIFFDEFCYTHVMFTDDPRHDGIELDADEPDPECQIEDIATARCPGCNDRVPADCMQIHAEEIHGGQTNGH